MALQALEKDEGAWSVEEDGVTHTELLPLSLKLQKGKDQKRRGEVTGLPSCIHTRKLLLCLFKLALV